MVRRVAVVQGDIVFINTLVPADLLRKAEASELAVDLADPVGDLQFHIDECFQIGVFAALPS